MSLMMEDSNDTMTNTDKENLGVGRSNRSPLTIPATYTPAWLADDMANLCDIRPHHRVLEPSAGRGALAIAATERVQRFHIDCYDLNSDCCNLLTELGFTARHGDFLRVSPWQAYNRVLMNPPSHDDRYINHVLHAHDFLKPGGRLVALIVNRFMTGDTQLEAKLRELVSEWGRLYQIAYPDFAIDGRSVGAAILVLDTPGGRS